MHQSCFAAALALTLAGCSDSGLPPLLQGAQSSEERFHACLPVNPLNSGESVSRELTGKLVKQFAIGSDANEIAPWLQSQGFSLATAPCPDRSLHRAQFHQVGGPGPVSTDANVYWKTDQHGKLAWILGTVSFTGP